MRIELCRIHRDKQEQEFFLEGDITIISGKSGSGKTRIAQGMVKFLWGMFSGIDMNGTCLVNGMAVSSDQGANLSIARDPDGNVIITDFDEEVERVLFAGKPGDLEEVRSSLEGLGMKGTTLKNNLLLPGFDSAMDSILAGDDILVGDRKLIDQDILNRLFITDESLFFKLYDGLFHYHENEREARSSLLNDILSYERKLKELDKNIELVEIRRSRLSKLNREILEAETEYETLQDSQQELVEQINLLETINSRLEELEELSANLNTIRDELNREQNLKQTIHEMEEEVKGLFPEFDGQHTFDNVYLDRLQGAFYRIRDIRQSIDEINTRLHHKKSRFNKMGMLMTLPGIAFIFALNFYAPLRQYLSEFYITMLALVFFGASALLFLASSLINPGNETRDLEAERIIAEESLLELLKGSDSRLLESQVTIVYDFLMKHFQDILEYRDRIAEIRKLQDELRDSDYLENMKSNLLNLEKKEEGHRAAIQKDLARYEFTPDSELDRSAIEDMITTLSAQLVSTRNDCALKKDIINRIKQEITQYEDEEPMLNYLLEEKKEIECKLVNRTSTSDAVSFVYEVIKQAVFNRQENRLQILINESEKKFHFLTGNSYAKSISTSTFEEIIRNNSFPNDISSTLFHIIRLSVKMSLPHFLIDEKDPLPLIIDEPLKHFDEERIERFRELCVEIAQFRQVIIFTQYSGVTDWAHHLVIN